MYYKNKYQLQNDNTDGHSLPGDHVMVSPSQVRGHNLEFKWL